MKPMEEYVCANEFIFFIVCMLLVSSVYLLNYKENVCLSMGVNIFICVCVCVCVCMCVCVSLCDCIYSMHAIGVVCLSLELQRKCVFIYGSKHFYLCVCVCVCVYVCMCQCLCVYEIGR